MTIKGRRVLEEADVIVYDRLVERDALRYAKRGAEFIDAGKSSGCHSVPQEEIENILIEKAREGKKVVRLKGGDPFVFGRGGEEMAALAKDAVEFEIVPGITSAIAVPAYAGIPVTHRDYSSSVHIITAHKREDEPDHLNYDVLARLDGTLIFLMGASRLEQICERLIAAGMNKGTPVAVIVNGTTAYQRQTIGTLENLPKRAHESGVKSPAVIVVGHVAALSENLNWRLTLPLNGKRVLVPFVMSKEASRAGEGRLAALLRSRGAEVAEIPNLRTEAVDMPLPSLCGYSWVVFTSVEGVERFFERLRAEDRDIREIGGARIAVIGPTTHEAVEARGLKVNLIPTVYNGTALGEALIKELAQRPATEKHLLLLRAENGAPELTQVLRDAGLSLVEAPIYRTIPIEMKTGAIEGIDVVAFTCASSVRNFASSFTKSTGFQVKAVCIGENTAKAARESGFETYTAKEATLESLAEAVEHACEEKFHFDRSDLK